MSQRLICIVLFLVFSHLECDGKLPRDIKICRRNDPNIAKCIIDSVSHLQPRLITGKLDSDYIVPPIEPLKLDTVHIDRGPNFQVFIKNLLVKGGSGYIIEKMKVNINELVFDFQLLLPKIEFKGKYSLNMRVALIPIIVNDKEILGVAEKFKARVRLAGKKVQGADGNTYITFNPIQIKIIPTLQFDIKLKDLFINSPTLSEIGRAFVEENKQYFLNEVTPALEKSLSQHFTLAANEIVKRSTFDELFPV